MARQQSKKKAAKKVAKKRGIIYLLTNHYMTNVVKIGHCESDNVKKLEARVLSLYSGKTGVPIRFDIKHAIRVLDVKHVEKELHEIYKDIRANPRREFFEIVPETDEIQGTIKEIIRTMNLIGKPIKNNEFQAGSGVSVGISDDEEEAHNRAERASQKRAPFNFEIVNIQEGEKLEFYDESDITATVVDSKKINFEGSEMFLTGAAKIVFRRRGKTLEVLQGPSYWRYQGEILAEMRVRLESKADS